MNMLRTDEGKIITIIENGNVIGFTSDPDESNTVLHIVHPGYPVILRQATDNDYKNSNNIISLKYLVIIAIFYIILLFI